MVTRVVWPVWMRALAEPDRSPTLAEATYDPGGIGFSVQTLAVRCDKVMDICPPLSCVPFTLTTAIAGSKPGSSSTTTVTSSAATKGSGFGGGGGGGSSFGTCAGMNSTTVSLNSVRSG